MSPSLQMQPDHAEQRSALTPLYQRYRVIAVATYSAVLLAGMIDALVGGIGPNSLIAAPEGLRFAIFLSGILGLLALEFYASGAASFKAAEPVSLPQLMLRFLLFASVFAFSDLLYSQMLFLVFLLYLYLGVSKRLSYAVALLGCLALLTLGVMSNPVGATLGPPPPNTPPAASSPTTPGPVNQPRPERIAFGRLIDNGLSLFTVLFFYFFVGTVYVQSSRRP